MTITRIPMPIPPNSHYPFGEGYWWKYIVFQVLDADVNLNQSSPGFLNMGIRPDQRVIHPDMPELTLRQTIERPFGFPYEILREAYYEENGNLLAELRNSHFSFPDGTTYIGEKWGDGRQEYLYNGSMKCPYQWKTGRKFDKEMQTVNRNGSGSGIVIDGSFYCRLMALYPTWGIWADVRRVGLVERHEDGSLLDNIHNYFYAAGIGKVQQIQIHIEPDGASGYQLRYEGDECGIMLHLVDRGTGGAT